MAKRMWNQGERPRKKGKGKKRKQFQRDGGGGGGFEQRQQDQYMQYGHGSEHIQLVSDDMLQYVRELANQLTEGDLDDGGKEMLVNNALEEFIGKEAQLCKDPVCSRAVETLVSLFTTSQLINFITSLKVQS